MFFISTRWRSTDVAARLILCFCLVVPAAAQIEQPKRFELKLDNNEPGFRVTPAASRGLILHRFVRSQQEYFLEIIRLDTSFQEQWRGSIPIEGNMAFIAAVTHGTNVYFLFHAFTAKSFLLFELEQDSGQYRQYEINSFLRFSATECQITGRGVLIGGYFNRVPLVLFHDLQTHQSSILPGLLNEDGELTQIKVFEDDSFQVLIGGRNYLRQRTIWIKTYQPDGSIVNNYALEPAENTGLIFGRTTRSAGNVHILSGVYGYRNSEFSRGLFISSIDPSGLQTTKYYNFGDLENFFNYMKARRSNRIKQRIERRKIRGKKVRFNYRFLIHEVIEHNDQFIVLGEAFYPQYTSVSSGYQGFFYPRVYSGYPMFRGDQMFDGYRYTHAVIIGFDRDGNLLWDNSFEISDVKTYSLEQFVRFEVQEDKIVLLYLYDNQIRTKIIRDNEVLEGKTIDPIRTLHENDVVVKARRNTSQLNYWYEANFYAYGIHEIESETAGGSTEKRRVFFVNKINL
ncbi:MAG TPA: hypothetical protein VKZ86_01100 [Cyclobacteriaceae bacterium]|nr:hypothetical protein [Cyclobacteriaceae bacterium]